MSTWQEEDGRQCPFPHIVRIERDGRTRTVIGSCFIHGGINGFDVSPVDGSLVIAAEGSLWKTDANGENAEKVVDGLPDPENEGWAAFDIKDPAWSPDGTQIAYADGGIRILDLASGRRTDVIEDWCVEETLGSGIPLCMYGEWFYEPRWAPDGQALLFREQTSEYSRQQLVTLPVTEEPSVVPGTMGVGGNSIAWSRDGTAMLFDYWWPAYGITSTEPALVRMSRDDFDVQVLWPHGDRADPIYSSSGNNPWQALFPFEASDGRILFFQAEPCSTGSCYNYDLVEGRLTDEGFDVHILLRNDALPEDMSGVLWDDSGEFIVFHASSSGRLYIAVLQVSTGEVSLLAEEDFHALQIVWGNP